MCGRSCAINLSCTRLWQRRRCLPTGSALRLRLRVALLRGPGGGRGSAHVVWRCDGHGQRVKRARVQGGMKSKAVTLGQEKPWDKPVPVEQKPAFVAPNAQQLKEYLAGATWIKLDENGTRRRSLQLKTDGFFVAKSDGQSGELPAFDGLKVQANGSWSVKENELRLLPYAGDPVVVQLQWLGDKRIMMFNGESWIRGE